LPSPAKKRLSRLRLFAHYPTVSKDAIVANVNMDEDQMLWPLQDIIPFARNIPLSMES